MVTRTRRVGFTGTRAGMTPAQKWRFRRVLQFTEFHHGGCAGADSEAHGIALRKPGRGTVFIHPSNLRGAQAACPGSPQRVIRFKPRDPLIRNRDIVDSVDILIACPRTDTEELRSGTWATVRYARAKEIPIIIIYPDGKVTHEEG